MSFRQRNPKVSTKNLQFVCRSQVEPNVSTGDPHVIRLRSFLRMTILTNYNSPNPVIPTERTKWATRNLEFVCRSKGEPNVPTRDPHVRTFALPQDDRINGLKTPLRMTIFGESPFLQICHSDRVTVRSDEESRVCMSQSSLTQCIYWRSSRQAKAFLRMTYLTN